MSVPYTFASATGSIPLSQLDANFATGITIGNSSVLLGGTITTLNNMSLANVAITSVNTQFPNGFLANSNVIVGTTTINLGSTVTTVDGLTLSNVTISSGNVTISNVTVSNFSATTANVSGTANVSNLVVIGNASTGGNVTIGGNLSLSGNVLSNLSVTGNVTGAKGTFGTTSTSYILQTFQAGTTGVVVGAYLSASGNGGTGRGTGLLFGASGSSNVVDVARIDGLQESASATANNASLVFNVANTSGTLIERMRINSSGNVSIATGNLTFSSTAQRITGDFSNATVANRVMFQTSTTNGNTFVGLMPNGSGTVAVYDAYNSTDTANTGIGRLSISTTEVTLNSTKVGTGTYLPLTFYTNGSESARIDTSQRLLVTAASGLGYGTGAGGTVTQATSKSTGVTLNKPTGQITMNNAALAAGASVTFSFTNSLMTATDNMIATHSTAGGTSGAYAIQAITAGAGAANIRVTNISGGSLSEALVINFAIIKGATS